MIGFYVTMIRKQGIRPNKVVWLLGPFDSEQEARRQIPEARQLAHEVDPRTAFDLFGTASIDGPALPRGVLQHMRGFNSAR